MTQNQISYMNYLETVQRDRNSESLTNYSNREQARHNVATEAVANFNANTALFGATEQARHNVRSEGLTEMSIIETGRHNRASESISAFSANEVAKHNRATEELGFGTLAESMRHNVASENNQRYGIDLQNELGWYNAEENKRDNLVKEKVSLLNNKVAITNSKITATKVETEAKNQTLGMITNAIPSIIKLLF